LVGLALIAVAFVGPFVLILIVQGVRMWNGDD
jgi:hypothetical protein